MAVEDILRWNNPIMSGDPIWFEPNVEKCLNQYDHDTAILSFRDIYPNFLRHLSKTTLVNFKHLP